MSTRMNKYFETAEVTHSRYQKNEELYKEISKSVIDNYDVKSNATILGDNNEIDVEKIKRILDTKYNDSPKRKSLRLEETHEYRKIEEDTKEYDLNVVIEKAKSVKETDYEDERLRKIRDTQFDILKNLDISKEDDKEDANEIEEVHDDIKELMDTISLNEKNNENDSLALDILTELKGNDDTEVLDGLKDEIEKGNSKELEIIDEEDDEDDEKNNEMINSFYTTSNALDTSDFEELDDFKKSVESGSPFIKIIIAVIVLVFIVGIAIVVKTFFFS